MESRQERINTFLLNPSFRNWALNHNAKDFDEWENILDQDNELRKLALEAKQVIIQVELADLEHNQAAQQSWERFNAKLSNGQGPREINKPEKSKKSDGTGLGFFFRLVATISFIVAFSGLFYINIYPKENEPLPQVTEIIEKHTENGQFLTVTLPDGSKVKLNSNSKLSYPRNFFGNRTVTLLGEAYFQVVSDKSNPFTVRTANFNTEVLGTSFNVMAYNDHEAKVSVLEGKVKVSTSVEHEEGHQPKILLKKEAATIVEHEIKDAKFILNEILWKDGILVFSTENIHSIASKIQRWYNVDVHIKNQAAIAGNFSGKYANVSLNEILLGMGYSMNFSFEMKENQIIITGKNN